MLTALASACYGHAEQWHRVQADNEQCSSRISVPPAALAAPRFRTLLRARWTCLERRERPRVCVQWDCSAVCSPIGPPRRQNPIARFPLRPSADGLAPSPGVMTEALDSGPVETTLRGNSAVGPPLEPGRSRSGFAPGTGRARWRRDAEHAHAGLPSLKRPGSGMRSSDHVRGGPIWCPVRSTC